MSVEYNIDKLVENIDFSLNQFVDCGNGLMLTSREIDILNRYNIDYKSCLSLKEIIYKVEDVLDECYDGDYDDLESVSSTISERDYYLNTNK